MSKRFAGTLVLGLALGTGRAADWKITTATRWDNRESIQVEYFKGRLKRTERPTGVEGHAWVAVDDFDRLRRTSWDPSSTEYVVTRMRRDLGSRATTGPTLTITVDRVTVDTGERKEFFGRVARHLITEQTQSTISTGMTTPAQFHKSKSKFDGWYIDAESLPREKRGMPVAVLMSADSRPTWKINQTGPAPSGLPVLLRQTSEDGERGFEQITEVTELVEAPLPDELFRPPAGFTRMFSLGSSMLPWSERARLLWEYVEDWFTDLI